MPRKPARRRLAPRGGNNCIHWRQWEAPWSRGGRNLNQALVASGVAFIDWQFISGCDRQTYGRLETDARLKGLGVWGVSGGLTRPWDYRSGQRKPSSSSSAPTGRRYTCSQIGSYAQAQILLRQGHRYLDGDRDGEACESLNARPAEPQGINLSRPDSDLSCSNEREVAGVDLHPLHLPRVR